MSLVTVLVNRTCGHCLRALEAVVQLAQGHDAAVAGVDVTVHPGLAKGLHMKRSPALMFEDGVVFAGLPDEETFAALVQAPGILRSLPVPQ